jgi:hypothetical protein
MQVARTRIRIALVLAMLATLLVGVPGDAAFATHGTQTLEVEPETQSHQTGEDAELTAEASAIVINLGGPEVDFEIESGPGDKDGNTPRTPDFTCSIGPLILNTCTITYTNSGGPGVDFIRAWYDHDNNDATVEYDNDEGREEATDPGAIEPDITDLVSVSWTQGPAAKLDCDDSSGNDEETNPNQGPGSNETVTCKASDGTGVGMQGIEIDGENLSSDGINDPDQVGADYDNFCTTGGDGKCTGVIPANGPIGTADFCFWTDTDDDAAYDPLAENDDGSAYHPDGGDCDAEKFDEPEDNDTTDVIRITWSIERFAPTSKILRPVHNGTYQQAALRQIQGEADDVHSSVAKVEIALRLYRDNGNCGNWTGNGFRPSSCRLRIWNAVAAADLVRVENATTHEVHWTWVYNLSKTLAKSKGPGTDVLFYIVFSRATDSNGNIETRIIKGTTRNTFEIV